MTSFCWLVVMDSGRFASPIMGIFCGGLNAYCIFFWEGEICITQMQRLLHAD